MISAPQVESKVKVLKGRQILRLADEAGKRTRLPSWHLLTESPYHVPLPIPMLDGTIATRSGKIELPWPVPFGLCVHEPAISQWRDVLNPGIR